jgi:hypothetical protein
MFKRNFIESVDRGDRDFATFRRSESMHTKSPRAITFLKRFLRPEDERARKIPVGTL